MEVGGHDVGVPVLIEVPGRRVGRSLSGFIRGMAPERPVPVVSSDVDVPVERDAAFQGYEVQVGVAVGVAEKVGVWVGVQVGVRVGVQV